MGKIEPDGSPKAGARRFDPATFLATAAKGRAISTNRKGTTFFAQGDATDAIFYMVLNVLWQVAPNPDNSFPKCTENLFFGFIRQFSHH
jgi:hypothetical protein